MSVTCPSACPRDLCRSLARNVYFCGRVRWCPPRVRQRVRVICAEASYGMLTFVGVSVGVRYVSVTTFAPGLGQALSFGICVWGVSVGVRQRVR